MADTPTAASQQVRRNIQAIAEMEATALQQRSFNERISVGIASFIGSFTFIGLHLAGVGLWLFVNRQGAPHPFDPYPYAVLVLLLGLEAILLSTFVLISQNHMKRSADRRAHLDLQINLLAESEMTKVLEAVRAISIKMGISEMAEDDELREMAERTEVAHVVQELDAKLSMQPKDVSPIDTPDD